MNSIGIAKHLDLMYGEENHKKICDYIMTLLIEFDSNKYTSNLRDFILNHYKGEK